MIRVFTQKESREWKEALRLLKKHDVYDYPEYIIPFVRHGDGDAFLFYFENEHGRAINAFHKRDISTIPAFNGILEKGKFFDIITPYGYGGMRIECQGDIESFIKSVYDAFDEYCMRECIVAEFARFHPIFENYILLNKLYDTYCVRTTVFIDLSRGEDGVWSSLKSKNRNMIRKAEKAGIKVHLGEISEWLDEFIKIYHHTMCRNEAKDYYFFDDDFFNACKNGLLKNSIIFAAEHEGKIISASMILYHENIMHYHLSGTYSEYMDLAVNNYILWEAAKWGCGHGKTIFHLGGGISVREDDSLFKFKAAFSVDGRSLAYQGLRIFDNKKYDYLVNLRILRKNLYDFNRDTAFLPKYRA